MAGFPIFGCAQPTEEGFDSVLGKIPGGVGGQAVRTIWYNMRQEPVVYIDGLPSAPRQPDRSDNMLGLVTGTDIYLVSLHIGLRIFY